MRKLNNKMFRDKEHITSPYHDLRSQQSKQSKNLSTANMKRFNENHD